MMALLLAASLALVPPRTFGDWVVACDNVHACEAVPVIGDGGEDGLIGGDSILLLRREAGPDGTLSIAISLAIPAGKAVIAIDGQDLAVVPLTIDGEDAAGAVDGAAAENIARAMAAGSRMTVAAAVNGTSTDYEVSLTGASAMLRHVDAVQGRADTVTAIVARGPKPGTGVRPAPPLPVVRSVRPPTTPPAKISGPLARSMINRAGCEGPSPAGQGDAGAVRAYRLDARNTLALVACGGGAYNDAWVLFIVAGGKAVPARLDHDPDFGYGSKPGYPTLVAVQWDDKTGRLDSYQKSRGPGDCGQTDRYVWDGAAFRLIAATMMTECREARNWPSVWHAIAR